MTILSHSPDTSTQARRHRTCTRQVPVGAPTCGAQATHLLVVICVHEHLFERPHCPDCIARAQQPGVNNVCHSCWLTDGHHCTQTVLSVVPLAGDSDE